MRRCTKPSTDGLAKESHFRAADARYASTSLVEMHIVRLRLESNSFGNPFVEFRAAPHKRLLFAARYQCVAISHENECYVIELARDD